VEIDYMETNILWQYDSTFEQTGGGSSGEDKELILNSMLEFAHGVARPTTKIVMSFPDQAIGEHFAGYMRYNRALLGVEILERVKQSRSVLRRVLPSRGAPGGDHACRRTGRVGDDDGATRRREVRGGDPGD
jgi:hypothetical protein